MAKRKTSEAESATFEESLGELQSIVSMLEDGSLGLETSLAQFERGIVLLRNCYSLLESAEARVEILTQYQGERPPETALFENSATFEVPKGESGQGADDEERTGDLGGLF